MTPRIVRAPKLIESDFRSLRVGTQEVPRVEGARPPLFGTEPEAAGGRPDARRRGPPRRPRAAAVPARRLAPGASPEAAARLPPEAAARRRRPAAAADARPVTALFSPPEVALRVGQAGGLALVLVGARDVQSIEVTLAWDPALAEVTDVAAGSLMTLDGSPVSAERAIEAGRARVRFSRAVGATGSGAVVAVTMKGLKAGSGSIVVESLAIGRGGSTERPAPPAPGRLVVAP